MLKDLLPSLRNAEFHMICVLFYIYIYNLIIHNFIDKIIYIINDLSLMKIENRRKRNGRLLFPTILSSDVCQIIMSL
jgi:uncharacterized membrane protein YciS (DUF1049 family)